MDQKWKKPPLQKSPGVSTEETLSRLASGELSFAALGGLSQADLSALAQLGAVLFAGKQFERSAQIFAALADLDPKDPLHLLHWAYAACAAGRVEETSIAVARFLEHPAAKGDAEIARALLLRARLCQDVDPRRTESDLTQLRVLMERSSEVRRLIGGEG